MRRVSVGLAVAVVAMIMGLGLASCGGTVTDTETGAPAPESPAAEVPAEETPAAESPSEETSDGAWTTILTLKSTDPKDDMGFLVSEDFTVDGDVRLVLDMPGAKKLDAVIFAFMPAGEPITVKSGSEAASIVLGGPLLSDVKSGLSGDFMLLATTGVKKRWSVEVQTKQ